MTTFRLTHRQADALNDFVSEREHPGSVRLSVDSSNLAGHVIRAELLDGDVVVADRLLHSHGSHTP